MPICTYYLSVMYIHNVGTETLPLSHIQRFLSALTRSECPSLLLPHLLSHPPLPTGFLPDLILYCHTHSHPDENLLHSVSPSPL